MNAYFDLIKSIDAIEELKEKILTITEKQIFLLEELSIHGQAGNLIKTKNYIHHDWFNNFENKGEFQLSELFLIMEVGLSFIIKK